ncbi:Mur ligase family protein [Sphingobacterium daejeonense]|jgi:UDP-N-acetylmuramate: L-alanyl-gamma-D-glutamyl-meso-diaminopimelate ligase|uniref:UDP-N-acetylmuramate--L-alanine ligase n=2 Tax=Sphingobacterium daejeonense TaxID=371142 RepID=UPI0021A541C5|nr:Mur ligase family protein [Sphingobacterium daejeonense]MCT1533035.1 Mur ligase family protein [Sphingobacterium daejeonense]
MRIHFIAIGGSIMHNLAINLAEQGHQVSGSDDQIVEPSKSHLQDAGLMPKELGWFPEKITDDIDVVILGMHADEHNPELQKAKELGIKIYSFPEFVYEQSAEKTRVVIAGTYGKTTITSMIMHVLKKLGRNFDYLVGAQLEGFDKLLQLNPENNLMIIEGDEYYASAVNKQSKFLKYKPNIALISGVEWDHFKTVISEDDYFKQFEDFIRTIVPKGTLIYNKDDKNTREVVERTMDIKINRHGYKLPEYTINKGVTYVHVGEENIPLKIFGKHNLSNIAGAFTVCEWLGVKRDEFYHAIQDFKSSIRYLEFVASQNGSVVYQDFAHTPSKLRSSIHAVKEQFPNQALVTVIELNAYDSIDSEFITEYANSMNESDFAVVFVNTSLIKEKNIALDNLIWRLTEAFNHPSFHVITQMTDLEDFLETFKSNGYNLLFMSSNNYNGVNMSSFADKFLRNF